MSEAIWLASYPPGVPATIDPDAYPSLHAMLLESCRRHAQLPAFDSFGTTMSFAEWERLSANLAGYLSSIAKPGDRLAIMLPNVLAYPVAFLAALRAGLTVVNVNPLYTPRELEHQLGDAGATAIVIMENFAHKLESALGNTPIEHVIVGRIGDFMAPARRWLFDVVNTYIRRAVPRWRFPNSTMLHDVCWRPAAGSDDQRAGPGPAILQYTGGTTGIPKAAMLSHRNLVANTLQIRAWIGNAVEPGKERALTPLPLYHVFSLTANLLTFASIGGLNVLIADPRDLPGMIKTMRRTRITTMSGVNTLFNALNNHAEFARLDFSALRFAIGGGAAVQGAVAKRWREITGTPLLEGYGLSEASPVVCINPLTGESIEGSVGLPVPSTQVSIRDDAGNEVAIGQAGEVWVRGPQVMAGYWRRPDETQCVLTADGWLLTGDIGTMDAKGHVRLLDRKKDMIVVSGFKVFPNEVEDVLAQLPGVLESAVIGVPDERTGQAVKLFVVKRDPGLTEEVIRKFSREKLAAYKVPRLIEFRDDLPKSNIGKILRKELH
jgi:long-chain acyl-CoA synthetase